MDIKVLDDLENKVKSLISMLESVRKENDSLKQELSTRSSKISAIETENNQLKTELDSLKNDTADNRTKLESVTERIQNILVRLESVN
ncbi:MAG: cell division protein ZapB [Chitinispirillaceae bacterium]|nr:cell division protein ZapB [Chitinispirillaceae bacterium]